MGGDVRNNNTDRGGVVMFKVVGYDSFSHEDWQAGTFSTLEEAKKTADDIAKGKNMTLAYVYDSYGKRVYKQGSF